MNKSIYSVFEYLGARISLYESGYYLVNNPFGQEMADDYPFELPFDYIKVMVQIGQEVNKFDPAEVYSLSYYYYIRIEKVLKTLQKRSYELFWDQMETIKAGGINLPVIKKRKLSASEKDALYKKWKDELLYCQKQIGDILESRKEFNKSKEDANKKEPGIIIHLPENFPIKMLKGHFNPYLSPLQASLFLQILKDLQVIPPYGTTDIGRLGQFIVGRHEKTIADGVRDVENMDYTKEDISILQSLLQKMKESLEKKRKLI